MRASDMHGTIFVHAAVALHRVRAAILENWKFWKEHWVHWQEKADSLLNATYNKLTKSSALAVAYTNGCIDACLWR